MYTELSVCEQRHLFYQVAIVCFWFSFIGDHFNRGTGLIYLFFDLKKNGQISGLFTIAALCFSLLLSNWPGNLNAWWDSDLGSNLPHLTIWVQWVCWVLLSPAIMYLHIEIISLYNFRGIILR